MMNFLYAYRGWILGAMALALLAMPAAPLDLQVPVADYVFGKTAPVAILELSLAVLVLLSSVFLRVQSRRSIGEHTRGFRHDAEYLVTEGIYSRIRHPLYLSNTGIAYSFVIFHLGFNLSALPFVVAVIALELTLVKAEDRYLENRFQQEWRSWKSKTPSFFPRLNMSMNYDKNIGSRGPENSTCRRSFVQAFKADWSTWVWLCMFVVLLFLRKVL